MEKHDGIPRANVDIGNIRSGNGDRTALEGVVRGDWVVVHNRCGLGAGVDGIVHPACLAWLVERGLRFPCRESLNRRVAYYATVNRNGILRERWHMDNIKTKLGQGGRIVLPAEFREALGVNIGDELILSLKDDEVRVYTRRAAIKRAQGMLKHIAPGRSLVDELIQERRAEAARE